MKIALITSEAVPFAKTGGLADVSGALPLALEDLGQDVVVIMPKYRSVSVSGAVIKNFNHDFDWTIIGKNIRVYFLKHDMYLREGLYGDRRGDYADNLKRFSYFCEHALTLFKKIDFRPDIIHCNDWQTALVPLFLKIRPQMYFSKKSPLPKTLLTIHNISYQGLFAKEQMPDTSLDAQYFSCECLEFYNRINLLKGGILYADIITTVSPTHAREVQTSDFGCGLEGVLSDRKDSFYGIINGLDYKTWNPQGDVHIFKNYTIDSIEEKLINKLKLQEACGLVRSPKVPLFGFVGRLIEHKGIDLILKALPAMCQQGIQAIVLGTGEPKYEAALFQIAKAHPNLVYSSPHFDDVLAHRIYAGSDFFLMPSRFEPCGLGQLISFKYGTPPIVYKTGGLADTVVDYDLTGSKGNGFVLTQYAEADFLLAIQRAVKLLADAKKMDDFRKRLMALNFSWKESAKKYIELFEKTKKS